VRQVVRQIEAPDMMLQELRGRNNYHQIQTFVFPFATQLESFSIPQNNDVRL